MDIVLTTLNAKYIHAAFGLRYLLANLGVWRARAELVEFDINQRPLEIVEALVARQPRIVGFGVYIWNVAQTTQVVAALKRVRPDLVVILGGPEVSYETDRQAIVSLADYVITGEADLVLGPLCGRLLAGEKPAQKILAAEPPLLEQVALPYEYYTDQDIAHRVIYVEASRGCPFRCEFCLSSLDIPVRQAPWPALREALHKLLARGARQLKFVDRTFNLHPMLSQAIMQFCLDNYKPGRFFHFEMVPDRLPEKLRALLVRFPPGALQFEVGVQSFNPEVCQRISRRQDFGRLEDNFRFLRARTGAHLHADLIAGLPGETLESFAAGFDRLVALGPQEIQVGVLKRLRGTPLARHDAEWGMVYNPSPPYEILQNRLLDFPTVQRLRRFARYWDLLGNSGNFVETTPLLWHGSGSPFAGFMRWSDWLYGRLGRTDAIALLRLAELVFHYLTEEMNLTKSDTAQALGRDYQRGGRREQPGFLQPYLPPSSAPISTLNSQLSTLNSQKRQSRHLAGIIPSTNPLIH
jgi:radical SAM superfamily enzyme YgiQ (UPF0313 family)